MNTYKFRAECVSDVSKLIDLMVTENIKSSVQVVGNNRDFPDCEVVMQTDCDLNDIRSFIGKLTDGHVILETIKPIDDYTGKRGHILRNVTRLESVTVFNDKDLPVIGKKGDTDIVVRFSNRRFQAVSLRPLATPEEIGKAFIALGENILNDEQLYGS